MTYFVKAYGWHENGTKKCINCVFDLDDVNSKTFIDAIEKAADLSPYRSNKVICIEEVVVLSKS